MSSVQFSSITTDEGQQFITAFASGRLLGPVDDSHPNFDAIKLAMMSSLEGYATDEDALADLFDVAQAVARHFDSLSDRVKVAHGHIYLDGDLIENALTKQILRFMDEGVEDWKPLVAFFEKVLANPNEHSREQLYSWLDKHDFTLTADGDIVGYKGVTDNDAGEYASISRGREQVLVNGVAHTGQIPNPIGAEIEMARSLVHHDPSVGCSVGLHVGTYEYASSFSQGTVLEVHVNPRDVVSVPTDCNWQKVRCCRYKVIQPLEAKYGVAVIGIDVDNSTDDDEEFTDLDVSIPSSTFKEGDRVRDDDGDEGEVIREGDGEFLVDYDEYGQIWVDEGDLARIKDDAVDSRRHPAQDDKGRFSGGRPGSRRGGNGRFVPES